MNDQEFIDSVETRTFHAMFAGCEVEAHLGYKNYDPGSWVVKIRADAVCRLIDLAKQGLAAQGEKK